MSGLFGDKRILSVKYMEMNRMFQFEFIAGQKYNDKIQMFTLKREFKY